MSIETYQATIDYLIYTRMSSCLTDDFWSIWRSWDRGVTSFCRIIFSSWYSLAVVYGVTWSRCQACSRTWKDCACSMMSTNYMNNGCDSRGLIPAVIWYAHQCIYSCSTDVFKYDCDCKTIVWQRRRRISIWEGVYLIADRTRYYCDDHVDGCQYMMKCRWNHEYTTYAFDRCLTSLICIYYVQIYLS